jgi:DsbC/DsbD-like thiol-disulfide interchange protein/cytochrome c biogenesis protein CcdA
MKWLISCFVVLSLSISLVFSVSLSAETFSSWRKYSTAKLYADEDAVAPGQKITLGLLIHLEKTWHTYWLNPGDSGSAVKLRLTGDSQKQDLLTGPLQFPIPERMESGPIVSFVYEDEVMIMGDVVMPESVKPGADFKFHLEAEWLVCAEVCIPAVDSFDLTLPVKNVADVKPSALSNIFELWRSRLPRLENERAGDNRTGEAAELSFPIPKQYMNAKFKDFFPLRGSHLGNSKPILQSQTGDKMTLLSQTREVGDRRKDLVGLLVLVDGKKTIGLQYGDPSYGFLPNHPVKVSAPVEETQNLWVILFSAFLGGLILNLMPCVFPILSMKLLSLVGQLNEDRASVQRQNMAYVTGVILSFVGLGGALALIRNAGTLVGWGFQLQSPRFVLILVWLFFLLAVQLFGYFEFDFLNPNIGGGLARKKGVGGSFFTGVLAVIVASPCTAPFMGVALGFALSQSIAILLLVFFLMGLGLSFPYLCFAMFPAWVRFLPRPGAWMQTLKEIMAFPLLLTCIWLVWLLSQLKGSLAGALALVGVVGIFFALWLGAKRKSLAWMVGLLVALGGLGILERLPTQAAMQAESSELKWIPFSASVIRRTGDETVFVDLTADWCLTCKVNERLVFSDASVIELLQSKNIRLVRGDWTNQDESITKFLNNYRRIGVPFYIAFGPNAPEGKIFPEILTPTIFKQNLLTVTGGSSEK